MKYYDIDDEWDNLSLTELIAYEKEIDAHENTFTSEYDDEENEDGWSLQDHQIYHADLLDYLDIRKEDERATVL
jgi:hypothetical protein